MFVARSAGETAAPGDVGERAGRITAVRTLRPGRELTGWAGPSHRGSATTSDIPTPGFAESFGGGPDDGSGGSRADVVVIHGAQRVHVIEEAE